MNMESNTSLVLRVCRADFTSYGGFKWPSEVGAAVEAHDWKKNQERGKGLHGWLYGQGDVGCVDHWEQPDSKWFVLEVDSTTIITLGGKVKFPRSVIRFIGDRAAAAAFLLANESRAKAENCIGHFVQMGEGQVAATGPIGTATAGDRGTATAGYRGTATAGDRGTATAGESGTATAGYLGKATAGYLGKATAGDSGTATAGDRGTATAGYLGMATAGYSGTATAGDSGTATAGYLGMATAGHSGTATAGDRGTATAGSLGTATAGYRGTATAGESGTATAGDRGELRIRWYDTNNGRYRTKIAYVGENGIKPNVKYRLDNNHEFVEVKE